MHYRIIQLDNKPIPEEKLINEYSFDCSSFADYVDELYDKSEENRIREIKINLSNGRLKNIFSVNDSGTVIFEGLTKDAIGAIRQEQTRKTKEIADKLTSANLGFAYNKSLIIDVLNDPLRTGMNHYVVFDEFAPSQSCELLDWIEEKQATGELKKGDTIYIGTILDFHY